MRPRPTNHGKGTKKTDYRRNTTDGVSLQLWRCGRRKSRQHHQTKEKPLPCITGEHLALLNSKTMDKVFRLISGSVAVSAFELNALPLPRLNNMKNLEKLILNSTPTDDIEEEIRKMYE